MNIKPISPAKHAEPKYVPIPMAPVTSNQVASVGHCAQTNTLAVAFCRSPGIVYHYPDVPPELHEKFVGAESIGKFFGAHIKPLAFQKHAVPKAE